MNSFPADKIPHPVVQLATNAGDTYIEKMTDSTIESKTDAGYRITRPRNTRSPRVFSYSWTCLTEAQKNILREFWRKVRKSDKFQFTDYDSGDVCTVRFTSDWECHYSHPEGYYLSLTFEEV